ncbi:MAG: hypothetical protein M1835_008042 [Candelina submexicana]|nr:MAG: hypothetical protein M1835_008042 [Candelina submexicana]
MKNKAGHDAVYEAEVAGREEVVRWLLVERKGLEVGVNGSDGDGEGRADEMDGVEDNGAKEEGRGEVDKLENGVQGMNNAGQGRHQKREKGLLANLTILGTRPGS